MTSQLRRIVTPQLVLGLSVATVGVLFLLANLGYIQVTGLTKFWPLILVFIGLTHIAQARHPPQAVGGMLWVFCGAWLLANRLGYVSVPFWQAVGMFWPVALVIVGLSVVWRSLHRDPSRAMRIEAANHVRLMAVLGGVKRRSNANEFEGGEATAIMGGVELDLSQSTLAPIGSPAGAMVSAIAGGRRRQALLDVFAFWGGVVVRVPQGWTIDVQLTPFLGGVEDKTVPSADPNAPCLILRGTLIMGGVEVKH